MHLIDIGDNKIRIVYGKLVNELNIDWSIKDHSKLKRLIDFALGFEDQLPSLKKAKYKKLRLHEGANHFDLVDDGVGTLGLLTIEDHFVAK